MTLPTMILSLLVSLVYCMKKYIENNSPWMSSTFPLVNVLVRLVFRKYYYPSIRNSLVNITIAHSSPSMSMLHPSLGYLITIELSTSNFLFLCNSRSWFQEQIYFVIAEERTLKRTYGEFQHSVNGPYKFQKQIRNRKFPITWWKNLVPMKFINTLWMTFVSQYYIFQISVTKKHFRLPKIKIGYT